jgi:hypothetical protein
MIWLAYLAAETFIDWRESKTKKEVNFGFAASFATSLIGLSTGSVLGQSIRAFITGTDINLTQVPFIIVIGSFISMMFIYRDRNKQQEVENTELNAINLKLKERRDKKYLSTITATIGNTQKVLPTTEILFFKSMDHYTHACTEEGEHIIDYSIKKLSEKLDPNKFIQIHRNCIVSLEQIESIENGSQWFVKTKSGEELRVSRNSRKKLKDSLS